MKQYQRLYKELKLMITSGELSSGDPFPTRSELISRFGGSTRPLMRAVSELEKEGQVTRLTPRKFIVSSNNKQNKIENVGLVGFDGELFSTFGTLLANRLYDRGLFSYHLTPLGNELNLDRNYHYFFKNNYDYLIMHDQHQCPLKTIESFYQKSFKQLILTFNPFNKWKIKHHGLYIDRAFPMYNGLKNLYNCGCRKIIVASAGDPPGAIHPRDRFDSGIERFQEEFSSKDKSLNLNIINHFAYIYGDLNPKHWAMKLDPETDGIIGVFDYSVIRVQEWIKNYTSINIDNLKCIGIGNTAWSSIGPNQFASYDCRISDLVEMVMEIIDQNPALSVIRRIKPKLVRKELLK